ncbi:MAG: TonB-dependent receptor [Mediterranea sp.]|jgi:outer membrane receptor for ferrienterochelin and colicins|nr:TonB-dependent receptor [Mediterranea sp.]
MLMLSFCAPILYAQQAGEVVTGVIKTTDGVPAELIHVKLKGTSIGAVSDVEGKFRFITPAGEYILMVSSIAAHRQEIPIVVKAGGDNRLPDITILEDSRQLSEVVVTGTRTEKRLSESPVLTTLISDKAIRKAAATSTLESLQDNLPGIVISPNAMGNNMRIKGLNSRYVLFLVDGERLVSEGAGGNVNLDQIDVNTIRRIEVVEGAASALYGSNAVGAVINIITKDPNHNLEAGANQVWESHNTWRSRVDLASSLRRFALRAGASRNASDGFGGDGQGAYAAPYEDYAANLKASYKPSGKSDINVVGRYFRHETFNPAGSMNVAHALANNLTVGANGGFTSPNDKNRLRVSANFDKYFDYDVLEKKNNRTKLKNTASYFSGRVVDTFTPSDLWELVGGAEYNHEENYSTSALGTVPTTKKLDDVNLFAQAQYNPARALDIIGGARYTYNSQFGSAFTPKLSLMYSVAGFKFRGGIGSSFRAPSIKELYYDFDHQGMFWVYGNPDLKAEKGLHTSLSAEYTRGNLNISLSGYHNRVKNKITQYDVITEQGANQKYYKNVSSATLRGVDVNVAYTLLGQLALKGSYSFCDARDNSTGLQLDSNVKHSGTVSATWNGSLWKSPFSLQIAGRVNSPILYQSLATGSDGREEVSRVQSKAYSVWKLTLVKPVSFRKHVFELTAKVDNLFNFTDSSFINPGRQYMVGLRYNFKTQFN